MATVSLEQYAGITVALSVGLELPVVLEQEEVAEKEWPLVQRSWREIVATSLPDRLAYTRVCHTAEDCLAREIDPLSQDPEAWVGLLGSLSTTSDANAMISQFGLTAVDLGALGRAWQRKAAADPELAKRMAALGPTARAPERVVAPPFELKRFPWSPKKKPAAKPTPELVAPAPPPQAAPLAPIAVAKASYQQAPIVPIIAPPLPTLRDAGDETLAPIAEPAPPSTPFVKARASVVDETLAPIAAPATPSTPFIKLPPGVAVTPPAAPVVERAASIARPDATADETLPIAAPSPNKAPALPFGGAASTGMSLEDYVEIRAHMAVGDASVDALWAKHGARSTEEREVVRQRFSSRFQRDPSLQQLFLRKLASRTAELRARPA
ncbi:MAG: hypothetical protein U0271_32640 [Polyangiaceae bacterium]